MWLFLKSESQWLYWGVWILLLILALSTTNYYQKITNRQDPKEIVIDEVLGVGLAWGLVDFHSLEMLLSWILFRILDILKPYPISIIDKKLKTAMGVVLDDLVAGLLAGVFIKVCFAVMFSG